MFPPDQFPSYGELFKSVGLGGQLVTYWPPTGHIAVLYVCGDWLHCLTCCCILYVGTGHVAWCIAVYCMWELVTLPDALLYIVLWELVTLPDGIAVYCMWELVALPDTLLYIVCGNWSCCLTHCCILCVGAGHVAWSCCYFSCLFWWLPGWLAYSLSLYCIL